MQNNPSGRSLLEYPQTPEQASEHLRLTLAFLGKHQLPPDPLHFTLAYEYLLDRDPALKQALDQLLAQGPMSHESAIELYRRFILDNNERRLDEIRNEMRSVIVDTIAGVDEASQHAELTATNLTVTSRRLSQDASVDDLRVIVSEVVTETRNLAQNSLTIKQMLDDTRHEIDNLREELDRTRQQANTDPLTGLLNRRGFEAAMQLACNEAAHYQQALTLLLIDIDHFKNINDTFGHLAGDKVLRNIGTILSANIKGKDTVGRYGGEEFAILLPSTSLANGRQVGEILRMNIERSRHRSVVAGQEIGTVTVSIGATEYAFGENTDMFLKRADDALYESKRSGRNRLTYLELPTA